MMLKPAAGAAVDRQILDGLGVSILEAAVGDAVGSYVPAAANRGNRVSGRPAAFLQTVERERAVAARRYVGQFLDENYSACICVVTDG